MARTGRPPAVGHRQPVQPPALRGRRRHQPGSRGLRVRRGAGQADARGDQAARRRELRPVGRPRGLRDAPQHRPRARGASSSPGSSTSSRSTSTRSASRGLLLIEPKPQEPTKHQYDYDAATVHGFLVRHGLEGEYRVNIEANHATLAGHSFHHEVAYAVAQRHLRQHRRQPRRLPERLGHRPVPELRRRAVAGALRDPARRRLHAPAASTSTRSCAARASTGPTCSTATSAASTRSRGRSSSRPTMVERGTLEPPARGALRRLGRRARPVDPARRATPRSRRSQAGSRPGEIDPRPRSGRQELLENVVNQPIWDGRTRQAHDGPER